MTTYGAGERTDTWSVKKSPEVDSHKFCGQLILTQVQRQCSGEKTIFLTNGVLHGKKINRDTYLTSFTKIKPKWATDLNVGETNGEFL